MIILIAGATHTGKTALSQRLIEMYHYSCLSLDHLKMGLIRSASTNLTAEDDDKLTDLLWPIVKEMMMTAIENNQNMIIEGCYIPYDWKRYFEPMYLNHIRYQCIIMSQDYINKHFDDIIKYANVIENRIDDNYCNKNLLIRDNQLALDMCKLYGCDYILIENKYEIDMINLNINQFQCKQRGTNNGC